MGRTISREKTENISGIATFFMDEPLLRFSMNKRKLG
jgi:hypothetical protein